MPTLTYLVAATLDGFIAGPDRTDPSGPDGFWPITADYVDHVVARYPETLPAAARDALGITATDSRFGTVLEGRRSYETGLAAGVTNAYPHLRHLVFSRTLAEDPDSGVEVVPTDPVATVRRLKEQPGRDLWLVGGGDLAGCLYDEIDELVLKLSPLTIGAGVPLFGDRGRFQPQGWQRRDVALLPGGTVVASFARGGETAPQ